MESRSEIQSALGKPAPIAIKPLADRRPSGTAPLVDEKAIEEDALALLLEAGRAMAAKNVPKPEGETQNRPAIHLPKGPAVKPLADRFTSF